MRLVSLVAISVFLAMPTTALAETPHYTSNGPNVGAEAVTTVGWGAFTLKSTTGPPDFITCHVATAGTVANPGGGNPGTDKVPGSGLTQTFAPYDCESEGICPMGTTPRLLGEPNTAANFTGSLPWTNKLEIVGGVVRQKITNIKVFIGCFVGAKCEGGNTIESNEKSIAAKGLMPVSKHGTSALHPGFLEYGPGSGELEVFGSNILMAPEGELKLLGYNEQEMINTKIDSA